MNDNTPNINQTHTGVGDNIAGDKYVYNVPDKDLERDLALAVLMGAWNESVNDDKKLVESITGEQYATWIQRIQRIHDCPKSPVTHHYGKWQVINRSDLWSSSLTQIYKPDLERLEQAAVKCFSCLDPKLTLEPEQRFASALYGIQPSHSPELRTGLADCLALQSVRSHEAVHYAHNYGSVLSERVVAQLLSSTDWRTWASNADVMCQLSEAAPVTFLNAVEQLIECSPSTLSELFKQSYTGGPSATNYIAGITRALEGLAWLPHHMTAVVRTLGDLHRLDPGGNNSTTPKKALINILSPDMPATSSAFEQRLVALDLLTEELPEVGWLLSLELLPRPYTIRFAGRKPAFLTLPYHHDEDERTAAQIDAEYSTLLERLVKLAHSDDARIVQLFDKIFTSIHHPASLRILLDFASNNLAVATPEVRYHVWRSLGKLCTAIRKPPYLGALVSPSDKLTLEHVISLLEPEDPKLHYQCLFSNDPTAFINDVNDWEAGEALLKKRQLDAMTDLYTQGGFQSVLAFSQRVENPKIAGRVLAHLVKSEHAVELKALYEGEHTSSKPFLTFYIRERAELTQMEFLHKLQLPIWDRNAVIELLLTLPLSSGIWNILPVLSAPEITDAYWENICIEYPGYLAYEGPAPLYFCIDQFLHYRRPLLALHCLAHIMAREQSILSKPAYATLRGIVSAQTPVPPKDNETIRELVELLLASEALNEEQKISIEWAFFQILSNGEPDNARKLHIHQKLSTSPGLFHELMSMAYRTDHAEDVSAPSKNDKNALSNAYKLFATWKMLPGSTDEGFDPVIFDLWLTNVLLLSHASGHTNTALRLIGKLLINAPSEPNGLGIHQHIAKLLNKKDMAKLREGYIQGIFVSEGAQEIDLTAKPELAKAHKLNAQADQCDKMGFFRLATSLRTLSTDYSDRAQSIIKGECELIKSIKDREQARGADRSDV